MPDLYDHLSAQMQDEGAAGLSAVDLAELPEDQKQIMLAMLRDPASAFEGVSQNSLRERLDGKVAALDATLALLARQHWLIVLGEPPQTRYRLNLRPKRGSLSSFNLWNILTDRLPTDWKGSNAT